MPYDVSNVPTSIFISGVESDTYWNIVVNQCGMKSVLFSYHYAQNKPKDFLKKRIESTPDVKVFVDSGAHTFFNEDEDYSDKPLSFWESYLEKYTAWLRANKDYIFACADLDIDGVVGEDVVDEWRDKYFKPLEDEGIKVCYVWHNGRGMQGWEKMCAKHSYVGVSSEHDSVQRISKMVQVAKKYGTIVHGMAMTKAEILVRIPFFSVDSTTWLVGQQYGELNWFDGRGMKRLRKREWRTTYKTRLLRTPFNADWDKLIHGMGGRGDTYELLRLNVIAYDLAERHVRKRLGSKQYWLKGASSAGESRVKSVDDITLPEYGWFVYGNQDDYKEFMQGLNIPPEAYSKEEACSILYNFHLYVHNDTEHIDEVPDNELFDFVKNNLPDEEVETREEALRLVSNFFLDNAKGVRNDFRNIGGVMERDRYLEEEEYDLEEVTSDQVQLMLPEHSEDSMPEIMAYDEQLADAGVIVERDEHGRFLKGQRKIRKPKNIYSELYPQLICDTCYKSGDCPQYKAGCVCAFKKLFKRFDTRNADDISDAMLSMANLNLSRLQKAAMFEQMDGGMPTPEVSSLIDQNIRLLSTIKNMDAHSPKAILSQRKTLMADGTQEMVTEVRETNPQAGGVLSKLFGRSSTNNSEDDEE